MPIVAFYLLLCWMLLCWMSLCWMSLCRVSWRSFSIGHVH